MVDGETQEQSNRPTVKLWRGEIKVLAEFIGLARGKLVVMVAKLPGSKYREVRVILCVLKRREDLSRAGGEGRDDRWSRGAGQRRKYVYVGIMYKQPIDTGMPSWIQTGNLALRNGRQDSSVGCFGKQERPMVGQGLLLFHTLGGDLPWDRVAVRPPGDASQPAREGGVEERRVAETQRETTNQGASVGVFWREEDSGRNVFWLKRCRLGETLGHVCRNRGRVKRLLESTISQ